MDLDDEGGLRLAGLNRFLLSNSIVQRPPIFDRRFRQKSILVQDLHINYQCIKFLHVDDVTCFIRKIHKENILLTKMCAAVSMIGSYDEGQEFEAVDMAKIVDEYYETQDLIKDYSDDAKEIVDAYLLKLILTHRSLIDRQDKIVNSVFQKTYSWSDIDIYQLESSQVDEFKARFPVIKVIKTKYWIIAVSFAIAMILRSLNFSIRRLISAPADGRTRIDNKFEPSVTRNKSLLTFHNITLTENPPS